MRKWLFPIAILMAMSMLWPSQKARADFYTDTLQFEGYAWDGTTDRAVPQFYSYSFRWWENDGEVPWWQDTYSGPYGCPLADGGGFGYQMQVEPLTGLPYIASVRLR